MRRIAIVSGIFVAALGLSTNAFADFCLNADNGINYRLQVGTANPASGTPIVYCSSPDPVKVGLNGYPGYAGVVRGNVIASDPGVKVIPA